jgi:hypothetical protein
MTSVFTSSVSANHVTTENETEQSITFPNSLDERKGLLLKDNSARVAERQPHFSCVLDSVTRRLLMLLPVFQETKRARCVVSTRIRSWQPNRTLPI